MRNNRPTRGQAIRRVTPTEIHKTAIVETNFSQQEFVKKEEPQLKVEDLKPIIEKTKHIIELEELTHVEQSLDELCDELLDD